MYTKPRISTYSGDSLGELIGPVETQYCELDRVILTPDIFLVGKSDISVTLANVLTTCEEFERIHISLIDSNNTRLTNDAFVPADGQVSGSNWTLPDYDFGIIPDPGTYRVEVIVVDADGTSSGPVTASFQIIQ